MKKNVKINNKVRHEEVHVSKREDLEKKMLKIKK